jgi:L-asparaginase
MTLTARALSGCAGKTIVLTGSLAPARFAESDAAFNFGMAFATAQTAPPGVYVTINGHVPRGDALVRDRGRGCFVPKEESAGAAAPVAPGTETKCQAQESREKR